MVMNSKAGGVEKVVWLIGIVVAIWALRYASVVLVPLAIAVFFAVVLRPIQRKVEKHSVHVVGVIASTLVFFLIVSIFGLGLYLCAELIADGASTYGDEFQRIRESIASTLGVDLDRLTWQELGRRYGMEALGRAGTVFSVAAASVLVVAFLILSMIEVNEWNAKIADSFDRGEQVVEQMGEAAHMFRQYIWVRTLTSALTGLLTGLFAWAVGLDFALVWGFTSFLLNYIPTLGSIIGIAPPTLFAWLQFGILPALGVCASLVAIQLIMGNYVDPRIQGKNLDLSPVVVLFSIVFWGWVWGIPGALLGVPLTVGIVVVTRNFESTRWVSILLRDYDEEPEDDSNDEDET